MPPESIDIDRKFVSILPDDPDVMVAFALYSPRLPRNEQELAKGLLAAVKSAPGVGLGRFVDMETGQLTGVARISLETLQEAGNLAIEGDSFTIPPDKANTLKSNIRIYYRDLTGIEVLKQAAEAAGKVWFPQ